MTENQEKKKFKEPNFLHRLLGKKVVVTTMEGEYEEVGKLVMFNRFELLVELDGQADKDGPCGYPVVYFKHAVESIRPVLSKGDENPFARKEVPADGGNNP